MMNDETEQFERELSRQPLRKIPGEWRAEILAKAKLAATTAPRGSFLATFNQQLSTLFWPHPQAWAGLAAAWIFILAVNFSLHEPAPEPAKKSAPPSPELIVELKKQKLLFAELVGANTAPDADRPKHFSPRPRSERGAFMAA